jgi:Putative neutral zinc metallopeptidase
MSELSYRDEAARAYDRAFAHVSTHGLPAPAGARYGAGGGRGARPEVTRAGTRGPRNDTLGHSDERKFTHGTSEQRKRWFRRGFESGDARQCDTFSVRSYGGL